MRPGSVACVRDRTEHKSLDPCSLWMPLWVSCREAESKHRLRILHSLENKVAAAGTALSPFPRCSRVFGPKL